VQRRVGPASPARVEDRRHVRQAGTIAGPKHEVGLVLAGPDHPRRILRQRLEPPGGGAVHGNDDPAAALIAEANDRVDPVDRVAQLVIAKRGRQAAPDDRPLLGGVVASEGFPELPRVEPPGERCRPGDLDAAVGARVDQLQPMHDRVRSFGSPLQLQP
jgi:hypothetical protein